MESVILDSYAKYVRSMPPSFEGRFAMSFVAEKPTADTLQPPLCGTCGPHAKAQRRKDGPSAHGTARLMRGFVPVGTIWSDLAFPPLTRFITPKGFLHAVLPLFSPILRKEYLSDGDN
jgi:hypothetical protein